jgi:lipopolysaccharide transport system ATP-binding protein
MSDYVIKVENLGKKYKIRHQQDQQRYVALRDVIASKATAPLRWLFAQSAKSKAQSVSSNNGRSAAPDASRLTSHATASSELRSLTSDLRRLASEEFWALRGVSFEVKQGEVLGIIGRNGAGKSTLLKILSRITEPSEGRVRLRGRVASLLEVGTGFHPELTGRENIFVNGAILGMTRAEVKRKFDEIVAFAEVETFLDTPVKWYSSGMHVRLAFAVAAHLDPEILLIDEVLAVGDAEFQKKSLGKMDAVSKSGRTVLFVSHNMAAIATLCSKAVWIVAGRVKSIGPAESVVGNYMEDSVESSSSQARFPYHLSPNLILWDFSFSRNSILSGESLSLRITLRSASPSKVSDFSILFYSSLGVRVAIVDLRTELSNSVGPSNPWVMSVNVDTIDFVEGDYSVGIYVKCADTCGNFLDLVQLRVLRRPNDNGAIPYAAHDRGLINLRYTYCRDTAAQ